MHDCVYIKVKIQASKLYHYLCRVFPVEGRHGAVHRCVRYVDKTFFSSGSSGQIPLGRGPQRVLDREFAEVKEYLRASREQQEEEDGRNKIQREGRGRGRK